MSLKARIDEDIKTAMRAKDDGAKRALRAIKKVILEMEKSGNRTEEALTEAEELKLLQKEAKQRQDSIDAFQKAGRDDLVQKEQEELDIIAKYLPEAMSEDDIKAAVQAVIAETGASSMKDMGKVMGIITKQLAGKADGKVISQIVRGMLG